MAHNPLEQFKIKKIIPLELFGYDVSFTNSSLAMVIVTVLFLSFFFYAFRKQKAIPSYWQAAGESLYMLVANMVKDSIGSEGKKFLPLVFTLFCFVLGANLLGLVPYAFTSTSHIAVTFIMAAIIFILILIVGFSRFGLKFLSLFLPKGTPLWLAPLMIIIELFSFLARPLTLGIRLAANMIAGHVLLKVMAGFIIMLGTYGIFTLPVVMVMTGFELFVAVLQAYIFTILTCVYINDAVHLH